MVNLRRIPLVLASRSPQRLALLARLGVVPSSVLPVDIDEKPNRGEASRSLVVRLAQMKAEAASKQIIVPLTTTPSLRPVPPLSHVLAADTIVLCSRHHLGKPLDAQQANNFLRMLSGRRHQVWTGVALRSISPSDDSSGARPSLQLRVNITRVSFKRLTNEEIEEYIATEEWRDSAGGYRIQGLAEGFVRSFDGSYSSIVGLPLFETRQLLRAQKLL